jgi:hypothetical protein
VKFGAGSTGSAMKFGHEGATLSAGSDSVKATGVETETARADLAAWRAGTGE